MICYDLDLTLLSDYLRELSATFSKLKALEVEVIFIKELQGYLVKKSIDNLKLIGIKLINLRLKYE